MFKKIFVNVFLKRRFFWRYANFDEISKIYMAKTLRHFALRLVSVFVAIYLFNLGYSLAFVFAYLGIYHLVKIPMALLASTAVIKLGPKHTIFYANILYLPTILALTFLKPPEEILTTVAILAGIILVQGLGVAMYDYSNMVSFAKVKNINHVGKQLGIMQVLEKTASIAGPLFGGLIASLWGPTVLMIIASFILGISALPLVRTSEPIIKNQKIRWRRYPWRKTWRSIISQSGTGFDIIASGAGWQLYLAALVFALNQEIYAVVGALTSLATITAFVSAFVFGKLIDRRHGDKLLRWGVILKSITNFSRPLVTNSLGAAGTSAVAEVSTTAYSMAFMRGTYDLADSSGYRMNYLLLMVMAADVGAMLACFFAVLFFLTLPMQSAFATFFILASIYILIISIPKFPMYKA